VEEGRSLRPGSSPPGERESQPPSPDDPLVQMGRRARPRNADTVVGRITRSRGGYLWCLWLLPLSELLSLAPVLGVTSTAAGSATAAGVTPGGPVLGAPADGGVALRALPAVLRSRPGVWLRRETGRRRRSTERRCRRDGLWRGVDGDGTRERRVRGCLDGRGRSGRRRCRGSSGLRGCGPCRGYGRRGRARRSALRRGVTGRVHARVRRLV